MLIPVCAGSDAPAPTTIDLVHSGLGWPRTMSDVRFARVGVTTMDPRDSQLGGMLPKWETQGAIRSSSGESLPPVRVAANETHDSEWGGTLPKWEMQGTMRSSDKKDTKAIEVAGDEDISLAAVALLSSLAAGVSSSPDGHSAAAEMSSLGLCQHAESGSPAIVDVPARTNTIHWTDRSKRVSVDAGERKTNHGTYHA